MNAVSVAKSFWVVFTSSNQLPRGLKPCYLTLEIFKDKEVGVFSSLEIKIIDCNHREIYLEEVVACLNLRYFAQYIHVNKGE